jgi:uncharacterized protein YbcC (UPF0753/DUF2309 family)
MNAPLDLSQQQMMQLAERVAEACARIAPTWPLDQFIAVNPYWGWVERPAAQAAAALGSLSGARLTMPREWFHAQWQAGALRAEHLQAALERSGAAITLQALIDALRSPTPAPHRLPLVAHLRDVHDGPQPGQTWTDLVTHQISQHCAAFVDDGQARWHLDRREGLLGSWRRQIAADRGLPWRRGRRWLEARLALLPADPQALIGQVLRELGIVERVQVHYLTALLLSINGWAAWCAYQRWQARLAGREDDSIVELLAIRLTWDWLLRDDAAPGTLAANWSAQWTDAEAEIARAQAAQEADWLLQLALEIAYQQPLAEALVAAPAPDARAQAAVAPAVQAVFCIDVRSEVFRRALEAVSPAVHTRGFAGFFGLPIAYSPIGSALSRPQLPGLLAAAQCVSEAPAESSLAQVLARRRQQALGWRRRWADLRGLPSSGFSFVETCGLAYGAKLLADSLPSTDAPTRWEDSGLPTDAQGLRPRLPQIDADVAGAAQLAKGILTAMGLTRDFAPLVLLAGHGSQSANNPHAAGLDCGACGGQTGEVNARVLADLLNDRTVRQALDAQGIAIPADTHFLPGLHNTTTDGVVLYDLDAVPAVLRDAVRQLQEWLAQAGVRARAERAASLGLTSVENEPGPLARAVRARANDWAQVRPEWGLANCAAFVVAPRARSRHLNLAGRSFLHDYDWRSDDGFGVLELIMTAPMVVTNWINLQYHASTVDNRRYGSGNKLLHNVVGGRIGVFEGNGGDLRIGLPLQSLHDGRTLRHTPLRLSVFIEAPRAAIDAVIARHAVVRDLAANGWLHLFRIDDAAAVVEQRCGGRWVAVACGRRNRSLPS